MGKQRRNLFAESPLISFPRTVYGVPSITLCPWARGASPACGGGVGAHAAAVPLLHPPSPCLPPDPERGQLRPSRPSDSVASARGQPPTESLDGQLWVTS